MRFFVRSDYNVATRVRHWRRDEAGNIIVGDDGAAVLYSTTRPGRDIIRQLGPTCAITWPMARNSSLRVDGWLTIQRVRQRLYGSLPGSDADLIRSAANRGRRTVIPNLAMTMVWNF
jgi:hypothetical protein